MAGRPARDESTPDRTVSHAGCLKADWLPSIEGTLEPVRAVPVRPDIPN